MNRNIKALLFLGLILLIGFVLWLAILGLSLLLPFTKPAMGVGLLVICFFLIRATIPK